MTLTPELIKDTIASLPDLPDSDLVHIWKVCMSRKSAAERKLVAPLISAVEKRRKLLNKNAHTTIEEAPDDIPQDPTIE